MKLLKIGTQSNIHSQHINTGTEFVSITRSISNQLLNSITHGVVCIIYVTKRRKLVESFNQHRKDLFDVRTMRYQAKHDSLYVANDMYAENVLMEIEWLESVKNALSESTIKPWSKYHSDIGQISVDIPGKHAILPLVNAPVHTLQTQLHCMKYIKKTVDLLNPGQTAVDVCDQPVYALNKEIQLRNPEDFGSSS